METILVNGEVVRPLLRRARSLFVDSQREFGERVNVSKRTVIRWEIGQSTPAGFQVARIARLVYPRDRALAQELAAALGKSLADLDIEAPAPPMPLPLAATKAPLVDSVLCVAAEAASIVPQAMRLAMIAALERMLALGLAPADVLEALRPASRAGQEK